MSRSPICAPGWLRAFTGPTPLRLDRKPKEYVITEEQRKFWAFQPVRKPAPPAVHDESWAKTPIDRFILARLESRGLKPVKPADKRTLIRRATFDLIGSAAHAAGSGRFPERFLAGRFCQSRGSAAGVPAIRRALGAVLAGRGALRGRGSLCFPTAIRSRTPSVIATG